MWRMLAALLALGCQGTSGGILPDAREYDAAIDPCADPGEWSKQTARPIAPYDQPPGAIAVDDTYVYWTEPLSCPDGTCMATPIVLRAPLAGGEREILFEGQMEPALALGVTRDHLFVSIGDQLWRSGKDGSTPEVVATSAGFAADADAVYYWDGFTLVRLAADTLDLTPIGDAETGGGLDLRLAAGAAWWLVPEPIDIWRMPLSSGGAELAFRLDGAAGQSLAVDGLGRAFLVTSSPLDPGTPALLVRIAADGLEPEPIAELSESTTGVAVDDAFVYWVEPDARRLSRAPLDGGCVETHDLAIASPAMAPAAEGIVVAAEGIALLER